MVALEFFFSTGLMASFRFTPRLASGWYVERNRSRQEGARRTLILGAGNAGDLLWRDLIRLHAGNPAVVAEVVDQMGRTLSGQAFEGETEALVATVAPAQRDGTS